MAASLNEKAPAKINLTLRVLGRRADGYHELESLVAFADLADTLALQPGGETALTISGPFAAACGPVGDNLVLKAVAALGERVEGLKAGRFQLNKHIPVAGGIGGGSADAAAALRLLARANGLSLGDARLAASAKSVGADVPVCLDPRPRVMRGVGEQLSAPIDLPPLAVLLVNPKVPLPTRDVFAALAGAAPGPKELGEVPREREALIGFLGIYDNDLTQAAIARVPVVADLLSALRGLPGLRLARMSGSGPTCFALFASANEAAAAARRLRAGHPAWWVHAGTIDAPNAAP
jgi:4-diphosphocytidyl-2-C-methyl-D-erythritol kinase